MTPTTDLEEEPSRRALVVEDDPLIRTLLCDALELEGYWVDAEGVVEAGRAHLVEHSYDVAVLDLKLPDGSGMDLIREARERSPGARIVVLSGFNETVLRRRASALGADAFLGKPFTPSDLMALVRPQLGEALG